MRERDVVAGRGAREKREAGLWIMCWCDAGKAMGFINGMFGGGEVRETGLWG